MISALITSTQKQVLLTVFQFAGSSIVYNVFQIVMRLVRADTTLVDYANSIAMLSKLVTYRFSLVGTVHTGQSSSAPKDTLAWGLTIFTAALFLFNSFLPAYLERFAPLGYRYQDYSTPYAALTSEQPQGRVYTPRVAQKLTSMSALHRDFNNTYIDSCATYNVVDTAACAVGRLFNVSTLYAITSNAVKMPSYYDSITLNTVAYESINEKWLNASWTGPIYGYTEDTGVSASELTSNATYTQNNASSFNHTASLQGSQYVYNSTEAWELFSGSSRSGYAITQTQFSFTINRVFESENNAEGITNNTALIKAFAKYVANYCDVHNKTSGSYVYTRVLGDKYSCSELANHSLVGADSSDSEVIELQNIVTIANSSWDGNNTFKTEIWRLVSSGKGDAYVAYVTTNVTFKDIYTTNLSSTTGMKMSLRDVGDDDSTYQKVSQFKAKQHAENKCYYDNCVLYPISKTGYEGGKLIVATICALPLAFFALMLNKLTSAIKKEVSLPQIQHEISVLHGNGTGPFYINGLRHIHWQNVGSDADGGVEKRIAPDSKEAEAGYSS